MRSMRQMRRSDKGFTLVEVLVSLVVLSVGLLSVSGMIVYGVRQQSFSRDVTVMNSMARAKIERLRVTEPGNVERANGGDLNSNVADHFDTPPGTTGFVRRWVLATGPAGTQDLTVAVISLNPRVGLPRVQIRALLAP